MREYIGMAIFFALYASALYLEFKQYTLYRKLNQECRKDIAEMIEREKAAHFNGYYEGITAVEQMKEMK